MKPGDVESKVDATAFYCIMVQFNVQVYNGKKIPTYEPRWYVFKADRYSACGGRLRIETYPEDGKRWKTADGAQKALAALTAKNTILPKHNAVVCHYVKTVVETRTLNPVEG